MRKKEEELSAREKKFCAAYLDCGNAQEAARRAGFLKDSKSAGERLLSKAAVISEIAKLSSMRREILSQLAYTGYLRLAFGSVSDAVQLLYLSQPTDAQIEKMDLFAVSEIRRPKDGSMEIKFCDRLKALEKLEQALPDSGGAVPFYGALKNASEAVSKAAEPNEF